MKFLIKLAAVVSIAAMTIGCVNQDGNINKQSIVGVGGAVAGGVLGSQFGRGTGQIAATILGTGLGFLAGSEVGKSLDRTDIMYHNRTQSQALEINKVGTTSTWRNPDTGASGYITPTNTYTESGRYCREYRQTIEVAGKKQQGHGKACRNPDGTWEIIS